MDNAQKALEMAAGVLLAVMIMSLIAYFFTNISAWPEEEDQMETAEQLSKFNLEYEIYDKKAMYGVDVISCLNKAQSNNEKYAEGGSFLIGDKYGKDYLIDVHVKINSYLKESIEIYRYDPASKKEELYKGIDPKIDPITIGSVGLKIVENAYTSFKKDTKLEPSEVELSEVELSGGDYMGPEGEYNGYYGLLRADNTYTTTSKLKTLLNFSSSNMKQSVRNTDVKDKGDWTNIIWYTALYDLKTRKFKCEDIKYSDKTGRVNYIQFAEIETTPGA